jgi:hypothetical protein
MLKGVVAGSIAVGGLSVPSSASGPPTVVSELTLPEEGARGLGVNPDSIFFTSHQSTQCYYTYMDGSSEGPFDVDQSSEGAAISSDGVYVTNASSIVYYPFEGDSVEHDVPDFTYSLAYDESGGYLWAGSAGGTVWQLDDSFSIAQSYSFPGSVYGLGHDGTYLWVGSSERRYIIQFDPATDSTVATYDYPGSRSYYDLAYTEGHLWLEGDDTLYGTDIDNTVETTTRTETPTATPTPTTTRATTTTEAPRTTTTEAPRTTTTEAPRTTTTEAPRTTTTEAPRTTTTEQSIQDSDGDGVIDSEDYAPQDPEVQERSDLEESGSDSIPGFGAGVAAASVLAGGWLRYKRLNSDDSS